MTLRESVSCTTVFHHYSGDIRTHHLRHERDDRIQVGIVSDAGEFEYKADICFTA